MSLIHKTSNRINCYLFKRGFKVAKHNFKIITLGSKYGGWGFVDHTNLIHSTIISCGLGEDASFDMEFIKRYESNVILVDPTPRAITHFHSIVDNLGSTKLSDYNNNGLEYISNYDLSFLKKSQIRLVDKAIWINNSFVKFYTPRDKAHVSHSITNFQNNYSTETDHMLVETTTVEQLINDLTHIKT